MKRIFSIFALATLFVACSPVEYDTTATITGTVIDVDNGEPIPQVTVTLSPTSKNTYTGMDGLFEFHDIEPQQYTVTVQKSDYQANRKTIIVNPGETVNVDLVMKKKTQANP